MVVVMKCEATNARRKQGCYKGLRPHISAAAHFFRIYRQWFARVIIRIQLALLTIAYCAIKPTIVIVVVLAAS